MEPNSPRPKVDVAGRSCAFELAQVSVGSAEYEQGRTGCTVGHFARGAICELDVRGGTHGIIGDYGFAHAICVAGGLLLGLEPASGVAAELFERAGRRSDFHAIPPCRTATRCGARARTRWTIPRSMLQR